MLNLALEQLDSLEANFSDIQEQFQIELEDIDLYIFGFIIPSLLILASNIKLQPVLKVTSYLLPPTDDPRLTFLRDHCLKNLPASNLSPEKIFAHCQTKILTEDHWYQVGLEASHQVYSQLTEAYVH